MIDEKTFANMMIALDRAVEVNELAQLKLTQMSAVVMVHQLALEYLFFAPETAEESKGVILKALAMDASYHERNGRLALLTVPYQEK